MGAADTLTRMQAAGFRLDVAGQALRVAPASRLTDELRTELRACKPDLLALLALLALLERASKRAAQHGYPATPDTRLPELAAEGSQVATVAGYPASEQSKAQERPYRLTAEQGDAAHAEPWDDAAIALFQARAAAIQRRGFTEEDAQDLAERLHLRDVHADFRQLCVECRHLAGSVLTGWRCGNHKAAAVGRDPPRDLVAMFQNCAGFERVS